MGLADDTSSIANVKTKDWLTCAALVPLFVNPTVANPPVCRWRSASDQSGLSAVAPVADIPSLRQSAEMSASNIMRAANLVVALVAAASFAIWYVYARTHVPAASTVNGVYSNPCCDSLILHDGVIAVGKSRVPFDLENMKFGLTAFPTQRILIRAGRVRIPREAGHEFRREAGHHSGLKPATVPI